MDSANPGMAQMLVPFILIFIVFYFILIRPQQKEQKKKEEMLKNLSKNDEVVTIGGIHGTISNVKDKTVILRVSEGTKLEIDKTAIASVIKKRSEDK